MTCNSKEVTPNEHTRYIQILPPQVIWKVGSYSASSDRSASDRGISFLHYLESFATSDPKIFYVFISNMYIAADFVSVNSWLFFRSFVHQCKLKSLAFSGWSEYNIITDVKISTLLEVTWWNGKDTFMRRKKIRDLKSELFYQLFFMHNLKNVIIIWLEMPYILTQSIHPQRLKQ